MSRKELAAMEKRLVAWIDSAAATRDPSFAEVLPVIKTAKKRHNGKRMNGEAEVSHQFRMCESFIGIIEATEKNVADRGIVAPMPKPHDLVDMFNALLCHDMLEDKGLRRPQLRKEIGYRGELTVYYMSREYQDKHGHRVVKDEAENWKQIVDDAPALLGKMIDRSDNLKTMFNVAAGKAEQVVYNPKKQLRKTIEAVTYLLPAAHPMNVSCRFNGSPWSFFLLTARERLDDTINHVSEQALKCEDHSQAPEIVNNLRQATSIFGDPKKARAILKQITFPKQDPAPDSFFQFLSRQIVSRFRFG